MVSNLDRAVNRSTDHYRFHKGFDKVPHRRLLYKLNYLGIRGSFHKLIISRHSERSQKVVLDGKALDPVLVLSGVAQGSV